MSASSAVTHSQALQALHTFTTLASQLAVAPAPPPFTYGTGPNEFPMKPYNSQPFLVVWLFLVTNPTYLQVLDAGGLVEGAAPTRAVVPVEAIAQATNLTVAMVGSILDIYRNPRTDLGFSVKDAFKNVTTALQAFTDTVYPAGHCPANGEAMLWLSKAGGLVAPDAGTFPDGSV